MEHICFFCGKEGAKISHHLIPRSEGGKITVKVCDECHRSIHYGFVIDARDCLSDEEIKKRIEKVCAKVYPRFKGCPPYQKVMILNPLWKVEGVDKKEAFMETLWLRLNMKIMRKFSAGEISYEEFKKRVRDVSPDYAEAMWKKYKDKI